VFGLNSDLLHLGSLSHPNAVYWAAFTPDGKQLATASLDNTVRVWSTTERRLLDTIRGHGDGVAYVGFLSDGRMVTASLDRTLKVWAPGASVPTTTLSGHQDYLSCATVSRTGQLLASGGFDKTVRLWDASGVALASLTGHTGTVQAVAISASGRLVASAGDDRSIRIWDVAAKQLLHTLSGHDKQCRRHVAILDFGWVGNLQLGNTFPNQGAGNFPGWQPGSDGWL
jgi:WD40 repeat protein